MKKIFSFLILFATIILSLNFVLADTDVAIYDEEVNIYDGEVDVYSEVDIYNEVDIYGVQASNDGTTTPGKKINIDIPPLACLVYILPIIFIIFAPGFIKDGQKSSSSAKSYYPPNKMSAIEVASILNGTLNNKDAVSVLFDLINKEYIRIEEKRDKVNFFKAHEYEIVKLKDYDGNNINERVFFDGLFKREGSALISVRPETTNTVMSYQLKNQFYRKLSLICGNINETNEKNKDKQMKQEFDFTKLPKYIFLVLMIILSFVISLVYPVIDYINLAQFVPITILGSIAVLYFILLYSSVKSKKQVNLKIVLLNIVIVLFSALIWLASLKNMIFIDIPNLVFYIIGYGVSLISVSIIMKCITRVSEKKSDNGQLLLKRQLEDFKNCLENISCDELKNLTSENKNYFYDMLPYVYVFDMLDKWIDKFKNLGIPETSKFVFEDIFSVENLKNMLVTSVEEFSKDMISTPQQ